MKDRASALGGPRLAVPVSERDHVRGRAGASITLLEYGDFQCPYCGDAHRVLQIVRQNMLDKVRFVFRHFPLSEMHPHAESAAEAAEAAGAQGQFWSMHDLLFENQDALEDEEIAQYAAELDLDPDRFLSELAQRKYRPRIQQDVRSGNESGVDGTPTFFINDIRYDGPVDPESMLAALSQAAQNQF